MPTNFDHFTSFFQETEPPILIAEEASLHFSKQNPPLTPVVIQKFIAPYEEDIDEYTEFVPGIRMNVHEDYHLFIYWKASLMNYQYILVVYDKHGNFIDRSAVGGTMIDKEFVFRSVARIDEDFTINIASSKELGGAERSKPSFHQSFQLEVGLDGSINTIH